MGTRKSNGRQVTAGGNKAAVEATLGSLHGGAQVASTTDPYETGAVSKDGTIAYSTITYSADAVDLTESTKSALENAASQARHAGLTVEIGGSALDAEEEPAVRRRSSAWWWWRRWCSSSPSGRWPRPDCRC
ncbi:MMPL family transporter [Actinoallomurus spadix]|uniref:MMPL family transporter n=1 Tax=Actinoallomurus spadix TaxID=79912 RepID=UPI002092AF53|nr:MMPL family transporter [Actinoallomurus spadix]MCO5987756.1 MMPL family transporter [Actinoallomurus spadix]